MYNAPHNQHFDFQNIPSKENLNYKILIDTEIVRKLIVCNRQLDITIGNQE